MAHAHIQICESWLDIKKTSRPNSIELDNVNTWIVLDDTDVKFVRYEPVILSGPKGGSVLGAVLNEDQISYKLVMDSFTQEVEGISKYEFQMVFHYSDIKKVDSKEPKYDVQIIQFYHIATGTYICLDEEKYILKRLCDSKSEEPFPRPEDRRLGDHIPYKDTDGCWFFMAAVDSAMIFQNIHCSPDKFDSNPLIGVVEDQVTAFQDHVDVANPIEAANEILTCEALQTAASWGIPNDTNKNTNIFRFSLGFDRYLYKKSIS